MPELLLCAVGIRNQDTAAVFADDDLLTLTYIRLTLRRNTVKTTAAGIAFHRHYGQSVMHVAANPVVGRKQPLGLRRKLRAAAVPPARHRDEQRKAQLTLRLLYDGPRLGIGHAHGHGRAPQGMRLAHMAQELRNTGAEAFCFPKDPDADNRP